MSDTQVPRPRNSFVPSYRPTQELRRSIISYIQARERGRARIWSDKERMSNQETGLPGQLSTRTQRGRAAHRRSADQAMTLWLELDFWLIRSHPSCCFHKLVHIEIPPSHHYVIGGPAEFVRQDAECLSLSMLAGQASQVFPACRILS
jgi:hypothetical protein